ncbi:MAG: alpha/beta fold hydrolase [Propionibacteriaceae bacterium]|jgi:pimeloyl-ACP methyl ester carboxylesterase|nr:alpha/beta fold hydrolase [Propionibacteriaceae bacterium]
MSPNQFGFPDDGSGPPRSDGPANAPSQPVDSTAAGAPPPFNAAAQPSTGPVTPGAPPMATGPSQPEHSPGFAPPAGYGSPALSSTQGYPGAYPGATVGSDGSALAAPPPGGGNVLVDVDDPRPPSYGKRIVAILLILVLAFALVVGGVRVWRSFSTSEEPTDPATGSTEATHPAVTPAPTAEPGQEVSIPPVAQPQPSSREYTMPDRTPTSLTPSTLPGITTPPAGPSGLGRYVDQNVDWVACSIYNTPGECATVLAPVDYSLPDDRALTLSLYRKQATASPKLGTIFVNPGGPGAAGRATGAYFDQKGLEAYDIIGWDPRGTGESTPVQCPATTEVDDLFTLDNSPDNDAERDALVNAWRQYGLGCAEMSGDLMEHVSTQDTVEDLDLMRQIVGDAQLNYFGYSYGTFIGAVYAQTYPGLVGRMGLDAAVNVTDDDSITQASGFENSFNDFASYCVRQMYCGLGDTADEVRDTVTTYLTTLDETPVRVGERILTSAVAVNGIAWYLYGDESDWQNLMIVLENALGGYGQDLIDAHDMLWERSPNGVYGQSFAGFNVIGCLDGVDAGVEGAMEQWRIDSIRSPIFSQFMGPGVMCATWPVLADPNAYDDITATGSAPILVIGGEGDSATPYTYAVWMAEQLASGVLITYAGAGHGTYGGKSTCVDSAVQRYFSDGVIPPDGLYCPV